jgi:uncharacterized protein
MTQIAFPFRIDGRGRTAEATFENHIRQLIEQLLFTMPGERVNRPAFGTGLRQLVFAPNSPELATATQTLVQGALQQHLGDVIQVEKVQVASEDSRLTVTIQYIVLRDRQRRQVQLESEN